MKFEYLSLLGVILLALQPVSAKRGGGSSSSSDGDSSSSGSSSSSSSSSYSGGGSQEPICYELPSGSGGSSNMDDFQRNWLYKWVGTYYNGSIELKFSVKNSSEDCSDQGGVFTSKLDGVLAIADMPSNINKGYLSPFIFLLTGWESGTEPDGKVGFENGYTPSDVQVIFNSISDPRSQYFNGTTTWILTADKQGSSYDFSGVIDDSSSAAYDDSRFVQNLSPCNGSSPSTFEMSPFDPWSFQYDSTAQYTAERNQINGTFDDSKASITVQGQFSGDFAGSRTGSSKFGRYILTFTGNADSKNSHTLITTGSNPSWEINTATPTSGSASLTTTSVTTTCYTPGSLSGALSMKSGVNKVVYGVIAIIILMIVTL